MIMMIIFLYDNGYDNIRNNNSGSMTTFW
jgi:hypothetical protein